MPCGPDAAKREWQQARQRVLAYLDAMGIPPVETLEISAAVLRTAREYLPGGRGHPVPAAMKALRRFLRDREAAEGEREGVAPVPPLKRGRMIPEGMERRRPVPAANPASGRKGMAFRVAGLVLAGILAAGMVLR